MHGVLFEKERKKTTTLIFVIFLVWFISSQELKLYYAFHLFFVAPRIYILKYRDVQHLNKNDVLQ